tara:strand:- start:298 stop:831 length:534 start_codon:yes stop_codon:yes gene_type:complete
MILNVKYNLLYTIYIMNFTYKASGKPALPDNINNAILDGLHSMPMKAGVADSSTDFSINRHKFIKTGSRDPIPNKNKEYEKYQQDVQIGLTKRFNNNTNTDSTARIANIRKKQIGAGSLNPGRVVYDAAGNPSVITTGNPHSLIDTKNINVIDQARRRVRAGGSTVPAKFGINKSKL